MRRASLLAILAVALPSAAAPVYRCSGPGGEIAYQDQPCANARDERAVELPAFPPANVAERDRLLQREAALDARLLKRAEIESAERIAREARWAREAELQAERERTKAAEAAYYYPVYAPAVRPRPHYRPGQSALRY